MAKHTKKISQSSVVWRTLFILFFLVLITALLLRGNDLVLLNPKGLIAYEQSKLMVFSVTAMLVLAIPTLIVFYYFAWKYRASNNKAHYNAAAKPGKFLIFVLWAVPSVLVLILARNMWTATHKLDPRKPITANAEPITVQVVALRWKWLFIYPQQQIATVNFVHVPTNTPIKFNLTADDTPMSSFWVPHWGGQLYAMTGHSNQLNLMANTPGEYTGRTAEINGVGFSGMVFTARASTRQDFDKWVHDVQNLPSALNRAAYERLLIPSENNPAKFYTLPDIGLYDKVLVKYEDLHPRHMEHE